MLPSKVIRGLAHSTALKIGQDILRGENHDSILDRIDYLRAAVLQLLAEAEFTDAVLSSEPSKTVEAREIVDIGVAVESKRRRGRPRKGASLET